MIGNIHAAKHLQRSRDEAIQAAVAGLPKSRAEALVTALTSRDLGELADVAAKAALEAEGVETENESKIVGIRSRQPSTHHHRQQHTNKRIGEESELHNAIERAKEWQVRGPVGWVVLHRQWLSTIVENLDYLDSLSPEEIEEMYVPGVNGKRRSPAGFLNGMLHRAICDVQIIDAEQEELKCPKTPMCTWWAGQRRSRVLTQEQTS